MPAFYYIAIDAKGAKNKGIIEAETLKQARQFIRDKALHPIELQPTQQKNFAKKLFQSRSNSISVKELALLTRQLATLLNAGMPVVDVLSAVAEQTEKAKTKGLILSIRSKVLEGYSLANAMADFPRAFNNLFCSTVAAGEKSGHLDLVLLRLADYIEKQNEIRQKVQNALIYPSIMVFVAISIVGFLLEYVVPKMVAVYSSAHETLPAMTQFLISVSNGMSRYGIYILILLGIGSYFFIKRIQTNAKFKEKIHQICLRIPLIGHSIKIVNTARFSRTFAILSSAGISVLDAMNISAQLILNIPIRNAIEAATKRVREGANINLALKQTNYFPPMSIHLIASGEASGQLEAMLERAANNQDNDITQLIDTTLTLFEPAIILIMGGIVLFIVLAILLPIFQLDQMTG